MERYTDMVFTTKEGMSFKASKYIVATFSPVLMQLLDEGIDVVPLNEPADVVDAWFHDFHAPCKSFKKKFLAPVLEMHAKYQMTEQMAIHCENLDAREVLPDLVSLSYKEGFEGFRQKIEDFAQKGALSREAGAKIPPGVLYTMIRDLSNPLMFRT